MLFDSMRSHMREKIDNLFASKSNRDKSGDQPIPSPTPTDEQPGGEKGRVAHQSPLPLITYSARGGCPTRHRPDLARHNSSDQEVTAYMKEKIDALANYSIGHGQTLTFAMKSEKIDKLLTELEALVMGSLPQLYSIPSSTVADTSSACV
ncbi:hypothetical protein QFC22_003638 [Naganishia vaughanmartiniae]|uniref:Uncharacterized protein n=1 Tax=Naganishia vaughanmartiniae TaxID=1424756 RepID=A0ACC2X8Q5_9TREE|nr:hypothetical protein QFC22_003638 [Naganishia vaughanmartiniae]